MLIKISYASVPLPALADKGEVTGKVVLTQTVSPASCRNYYFAKSIAEHRPWNQQSKQIKWEGGGAKMDFLQATQQLWGAVRSPLTLRCIISHEPVWFLPLMLRGQAGGATLLHLQGLQWRGSPWRSPVTA